MHATTPLDIATRLIAFNTCNPPGNELPCAQFAGGLLRRAGFDVGVREFAPGRANLCARLPGAGEAGAVCFCGHLDTVPLGQSAWSDDPFAGVQRDGLLYGRGASDMKSGVAAMLAAMLQVAGEARRPRDIHCILTGGEESGCIGSLALDPAELPRGVDALVVCEPTGNTPVLGHKGALWLRAHCRGRGAHGSMPWGGESAIAKSIEVLAAVQDGLQAFPAHPDLGPVSCNVGTFCGGTRINMVPDEAVFELDIRSVPPHGNRTLLRAVAEAAGERADLEVILDLACVHTSRDHAWVREALALAGECGLPAAPGYVSYFTDASVLAPLLGDPPTLVLGPGEAGLAHCTDEYCRVDKIQEAARFYRALALRQ